MFQHFSAASSEDWKKQAVKDLKSTPFEDIIWKKTFGKILPYYTEIPTNSGFLLSESNNFLNMPQILLTEGGEKNANLAALEDLNAGADAVIFDLSDIKFINFDILLKDIALQHCSVAFFAGNEENYELFEQYILKNYADETENLKGFFDAKLDIAAKKTCQNLPNFSPIVFHCDTQDEKHAVAECIAFFADMTKKAPDFAAKIVFSLAIYDDFFIEIAKIRALKKLLLPMSKKANIAFTPRIHAHTTPKITEKELTDPYLNMISNTTQAMSAAIAGVDFLTVLPHDYRMPQKGSFSVRTARNVVNILREESFLAQVADASAGAYYTEVLTEKIAQEAYQSAF